VEEQERQAVRASEQAPLLPPEQGQAPRLVLVLALEQPQEQEPKRLPEELLPEPELVQLRADSLADWQAVVPSSHLTLALSSCIHSSPGLQTGRGPLQRVLTSRT
jgi:hypothetical protein